MGTRLLGPGPPRAPAWLAAAGALGLLLVMDLARIRAPGALGPSWRRQTPKGLEDRHGPVTAALLWGLDAGLVVTTFRVTSLSWAALAVAALGLVPWWSGLVYALGFVVPLGAMILLVPRRTDTTGETDPEPGWLVERIQDLALPLKPAALVMLATACAICLTVGAAFGG